MHVLALKVILSTIIIIGMAHENMAQWYSLCVSGWEEIVLST